MDGRKSILEDSIEKIAQILNAKVEKEKTHWITPLSSKYRYFDQFNREYKACFSKRKNGVIVRVIPSKIEKRLNLKDEKKEFIVRDGKIYRTTDIEIIIEFIKNFFSKRNYNVDISPAKKTIGIKHHWIKAIIKEGSHRGDIEIVRTIPYWKVVLRDEDPKKPFFCTPFHQYIFHILPELEIGKSIEEILIDYQESEIATTSVSPISMLRRAIYGFKSPNLRAFYSEEGLFPEVKHRIRLCVFANLGFGIANASVFVRVAEKLKGNAWYTIAVGALAFARAPAESYYMRKSLGLTEHLPSTSLQKFIDSQEFKRIYESKEIKSWRNFERALTEIFRKRENFAVDMENYMRIKENIYKAVEEKDYQKVALLLKDNLKLDESELNSLKIFINNLLPFNKEKIVEDLRDKVKKLSERNILKPGSDVILEKYLKEIFSHNLLRYSCNKAFKLFHDRLKQEERTPTKQEIHQLIRDCKRNIIPFRIFDILLFISLYIVGYTATFFPNLPDIAIPIYYLFYGASAHIITAALNRFSSQVGLQYLYRQLENAPTIRSAADVWNEFNSHIMRLWAVFSSLGLMLGVMGKILSSITGNFSRYFVEGIALLFYIQGFREWFLYYEKLEKKSKMEE